MEKPLWYIIVDTVTRIIISIAVSVPVSYYTAKFILRIMLS